MTLWKLACIRCGKELGEEWDDSPLPGFTLPKTGAPFRYCDECLKKVQAEEAEELARAGGSYTQVLINRELDEKRAEIEWEEIERAKIRKKLGLD